MVVAANGNDAASKLVRSPALAHCAIGVGAYELTSLSTTGAQCLGPTKDDRIKPDVQGPTGTISATNTGVEATAAFGETSGATPYVAGAAALVWSRLDHAHGVTEPGHVYAQLILSGNAVSPFADKAVGAGALTLATDGVLDHCKIELGDQEFEDITVEVPVLTSRLDAAIWWPEKATDGDVHNTIALSLIDPLQNEEADGGSGAGVFDAARNITQPPGHGWCDWWVSTCRAAPRRSTWPRSSGRWRSSGSRGRRASAPAGPSAERGPLVRSQGCADPESGWFDGCGASDRMLDIKRDRPTVAAGCPMVVKPAAQTLLSMLALARILDDAGLPDGVFNVITTSNSGGMMEPLIRDSAATEAVVHRIHPSRAAADRAGPKGCCAPRWSSAATPRSRGVTVRHD